MESPVTHRVRNWFVLLGLLLSLQRGTTQFVGMAAEVEIGNPSSQGIETAVYTLRCVVGTNLSELQTWVSGNSSGRTGTRLSQSFESVDGNPG